MRQLRRGMWAGIAVAWVGCGSPDDRDNRPTDALDLTADTGRVDAEEPDPDPIGGAEVHNEVRATAVPTPSPPLEDLVWDQALARIARRYARQCVWAHSNKPGLGENLYFSSWESSVQEAVTSWASEISMYDYATNTCSGVCGHYTQIVWRSTERVGCGFADCPTVAGIGSGGRVWVCNYDPPGNWVGEKPY